MKPFLSVVIPAYNEEHRLPDTLRKVTDHLGKKKFTWEVIVVDDGSTDGTGRLSQTPGVRIEKHKCNYGKGRAIKTGMLVAEGEWRLFMDADGSVDISFFDRLWNERSLADVVIGSRIALGAYITLPQGAFRKTVGSLARNILPMLKILPHIRDTQCGFKLFSERAAESIFNRTKIDGWGSDIEMLTLADLGGFKVVEIPIEWADKPDSKFHFYNYINMLWELCSIKIRTWLGKYE